MWKQLDLPESVSFIHLISGGDRDFGRSITETLLVWGILAIQISLFYSDSYVEANLVFDFSMIICISFGRHRKNDLIYFKFLF
jgi:hypothetical protein